MSPAFDIIHQTPYRFRLRPRQGAAVRSWTWLRHAFETIEGVVGVRVNRAAGSVAVRHDGRPGILTALHQVFTHLDPGAFEKDGRSTLKTFPWGSALTLAATPFLPSSLRATLTWMNIGRTVVKGADVLLHRGVKVEILDAVAVGVTARRGEWLAANVTQFLMDLGEHLQASTERRSENLVRRMLLPVPKLAWVDRDGTLIQIPVADVQVDEVVVVSAGELIPVDGEVISGGASVNQASLTGESAPTRKEPGMAAISGTVVEEGRIHIRAVRVGDRTAIARISRLIESSLREGSRTQRLAEKMADKRVWFTFGMGALMFALTRDPRRLASTFLVDFSCGLKITTPAAFKTAMYQGGSHGILFKSGEAIENLAQVDTVLFDKTGTLTHGDLEVSRIHSFHDDWPTERLLSLVASVEEHTAHPVAEAIVREANRRRLPHMAHGEVDFIIAHGLRSRVDGALLRMGSRHYLEDDEGVSFSEHADVLGEMAESGHLLFLVAVEHAPVGLIALRDHLREETVSVLERLRRLGVEQLMMLTGDVKAKADQLGGELRLDRVYAELVPEQKAEIVRTLQAQGRRVALVGDGINDAPALAAADVGVAMPRSAQLTRETADVSLMPDQLSCVADARELALRTMRVIQTNFNVALGANAAILLGAAMGRLSPIMTSLLHNGTTLGVLGHAIGGVRMPSDALAEEEATTASPTGLPAALQTDSQPLHSEET